MDFAELLMYQAVLMHVDGGEGSGNWGHEGRPGEVGGSAEGSGGSEGAGVRSELKPKNTTYVDAETYREFQMANLRGKDNPNRIALSNIYEEGGHEAVMQEFYNFRMAQSEGEIHQISDDEADEVLFDSMGQNTFQGWFRDANSKYKPRVVESVIRNGDTRSAALSIMYTNYKEVAGGDLSFEEFLTTPITMYRGGHGQVHTQDDVFSSYSFSRSTAEKFAGQGENAKVYEAKIRPIDTYGSVTTNKESEIMVPSVIAPNGNVDQQDSRWDSAICYMDGGPGSGHFGHASKPGSRGGSISEGQTRTLVELRQATRSINRDIVSKYTGDLESGWSGRTEIKDIKNASGMYRYSGVIFLRPDADDGTIVHELLHSYSKDCNGVRYLMNWNMEEATVELLTQEICKKEGISNHKSYDRQVNALRKAANFLGWNHLDFAIELLNKPITRRYKWLENEIHSLPQRPDEIAALLEVISCLRS